MKEREFSEKLGTFWSWDIYEESPEKLDCIIDTTPAWLSVIESLKNLEPGGGDWSSTRLLKKRRIRDLFWAWTIPSIYVWKRKSKVLPTCQKDVSEFLALAAEMRIKPEI